MGPIGRRVDDFDAGIGGPYPMPQACALTQEYCICDGCAGECPGGGSCGEPSSPCGVEGELDESNDCKNALNGTVAMCPEASPSFFNGGVFLKRKHVSCSAYRERF